MTGRELFACYAFPPNELGYCGPADTAQNELADHAEEFDGAWPYLVALADAAGVDDPLDVDVVRNYWVGGPLLDEIDPEGLVARLQSAFVGQVTGILDNIGYAVAHHSFHVLAVYPWIRFLERDPTTPLQVMQDCRIRWGTVESVESDHVVITSAPLMLDDGVLALGDAVAQRVRWRQDGASTAPVPAPGDTVSAHWDWVCGTLTDDETADLAASTQATLFLVNRWLRAGS